MLETQVNYSFDRYTWEYEFYLGDLKFEDSVTHSYRLICDNPYYIYNSNYNAHFVCDGTYWVDFESDSIQETQVYKCGDDCYDIFLVTDATEKLKFKSIGGINTNYKDVKVSVVLQTTQEISQWLTSWAYDCKSDTTADVLMFAFIFFILLCMWLLTVFIMKVPIITIVVNVGFAIFGMALIGCNSYIGGILIILAFLFTVYEVLT